MKRLSLILLLLIFLSCNNNADNTDKAAKKPETLDPAIEGPKAVDRTQYFIWSIDTESKTKTLNPLLQKEYFHVDTLIIGLNERFSQVLLEKKGMSRDTLYTAIGNAEYLTERMGSSGAEEYIALAVINLTSVPGINYVRIDFKEGSHASPDVWSRESFNHYKEAEIELD